jgi:hypothetical protein
MAQPDLLRITGDVTAIDRANLTRKGGSLTATLRKSVRAGLGDADELAAAAVDLGDGHSVLLLSGAAAGAQGLRVRKTGPHRVELLLETDQATEIDDLTAAFLRLRVEQYQRGRLTLSPPVDAAAWRLEMAATAAALETVAASVVQPDEPVVREGD